MMIEGPHADCASAGGTTPVPGSRYQLAFEAQPLGILFQDAAGAILDANPAAELILGLAKAQLLGRDFVPSEWQAIHEDGSPFPGREHPALEVLRTGQAVENVVIGLSKPGLGATLWLQVASMPLGDPAQGQPREAMTTILDITATRQARLASEESAARVRTIFEAGSDAVFIRPVNGCFLEANAVATRRYGYSLEEFRTMRSDDLTPPRMQGEVPERVHESVRKGLPFEWVHQAKDGSEVPVTISVYRMDLHGTPCYVSRARDLRGQRALQARARANRIHFEAALASSTDPMAMTDLDGNFMEVNDAWVTYCRVEHKAACAKTSLEFCTLFEAFLPSGEPLPADQCVIDRALRGERGSRMELLHRDRATGATWIGSYSFGPIRDEAGAIMGSVITARDITARKNTEDALRRSQAMLARTEQAVHLGSWEWDVDTDTVVWSTELFNLLRLDPARGAPPYAEQAWIHPPEDWARLHQAVAEAIGKGVPFALELQCFRQDGEVWYCANQGTPEWGADGKVHRLHGSVQDITERKKAEQLHADLQEELRTLVGRLRKAQEDERLRVSREIHDDLGQLLTALKIEVGWLERKLGEAGLPPALQATVDRVVYASELTDTLLATVQRIATDLRPSLVDQLGLEGALRHELRRLHERSGLDCAVVGEGPFPVVPRPFKNDLFYLCREALTNVLRHAQAARVEVGWRQEGGMAVFTLADDGVGMAGGALASNPAVGLAGMRERAALCNGTITFERNPPHGTRVTVRVPTAAPVAEGSKDL